MFALAVLALVVAGIAKWKPGHGVGFVDGH
jgi:hypothetical protein